MPISFACYKKLLDIEPTLEDMHEWQPEVAKTLQYILDYTPDRNGGKTIEQTLERSFVIDVDVLGGRQEIELKPNGRDTLVSQQNKEEFVRLYLDYEFNK